MQNDLYEDKNVIPEITDPHGSSWRQPDRAEILIDDTHALMSEESFNKLAEYSMSQPSGVYPGKMWRRNQNVFKPNAPKRWVLCWYGAEFEDGGEKYVSNNYRKILLSEQSEIRELLCQICDRDYPVWFTDDELWNQVCRRENEKEIHFLCPTCFARLAERLGVVPVSWQMTPRIMNAEA